MKKSLSIVVALVVLLTMTLPAFASVAFVPSIEQKLAPEGISYVVLDKDGNKVDDFDGLRLVVTPLVEASTTPCREVGKILVDAYDELKAAQSLEEIIMSLEEAIKAYNPNYSIDDFVVSNIFDISLRDDEENMVPVDPSYTVKVTLDTGLLAADPTPLFAHRYNSGSWIVVADEDVNRNSDGEIELTLDGLSAVAVLEHVDNYSVENPTVTSPQTGFNAYPYVIGFVAIIGVAACALALKKREN